MAGAVKRDADHRLHQAMLGHGRSHVGLMMLDLQQRQSFPAGALHGVTGAGVVGVQVANQQLRLEGEQVLVMGDGLGEGTEGGVVIEVAEVMAEQGMPVASQGKGGLELPAERQDRLRAARGQR